MEGPQPSDSACPAKRSSWWTGVSPLQRRHSKNVFGDMELPVLASQDEWQETMEAWEETVNPLGASTSNDSMQHLGDWSGLSTEGRASIWDVQNPVSPGAMSDNIESKTKQTININKGRTDNVMSLVSRANVAAEEKTDVFTRVRDPAFFLSGLRVTRFYLRRPVQYIKCVVWKLKVLAKLTVGYWDDELVDAMEVHSLTHRYDGGAHTLDERWSLHQGVIQTIGTGHALMWMFFPLGAFVAKFGETANHMPVFTPAERSTIPLEFALDRQARYRFNSDGKKGSRNRFIL